MRMITPRAKGFTLIELLMYVAILGSLLIAVSLYFAITAESRVKNQTISEVNEQGALIMEHITSAIRNAESVNGPYPGASFEALTLNVSTSSDDPTVFNLTGSTSTVLGYPTDGTTTDTDNSGFINATKFVASATGTVTTLYARIGSPVAASPNNKGQMAIYSGATPTTRLANSSDVTLVANDWNAFPIPATSVTSGQTYWLAFNTNGLTSTDNNMRYHTGTSGQSQFVAQAYGTWPSSWSGSAPSVEFSVYAQIEVPSSSGAMQIKQGAATAVSLNNSSVQLSSLSFTNLSRSSTPGVVQVSFVISRVNASNRNEYDYQKTFTSSTALRWP